MSESDAQRADAQRWDLPSVEGAPLPRAGAKGVNVMHLTLVEREAWDHGYRDGHVEGVRKGEAELGKRIAEVDVKIAALEAIIGMLAKPLAELDAQVENELTRLSLAIAKHLARRELKIDPAQVIGIIRHTVGLLPLAARNIRVHLHPDDASIVREKLARASGEQDWQLTEDPLMARGGCRITSDQSSIDARFEASVATVMSNLLGDERLERAPPKPEKGA